MMMKMVRMMIWRCLLTTKTTMTTSRIGE